MANWPRYQEPEYHRWRQAVLRRDRWTCQECGWRPAKGKKKGLSVHHIKSYADFVGLRYDVPNGITLCRDCHLDSHRVREPRERIHCACGCGTEIWSRDEHGRIRRYANHHAARGKKRTPEQIAKMKEAHAGKVLSEEHRKNISRSLHATTKRIGRPPGAPWKYAAMSEAEFCHLYPMTPNDDLARALNTSVPSVLGQAKRLGLRKEKTGRPPERGWTNPLMSEEEFRRLYPITPNRKLAKRIGVSAGTVVYRAKRMGLSKAKEYRANE